MGNEFGGKGGKGVAVKAGRDRSYLLALVLVPEVEGAMIDDR
jgi:hypothetical protein